MYNLNPNDDMDEDLSSEAPEASNEHQEADVQINQIEQRMMNMNRMAFSSNGESKQDQYYRSKSQNMNKPLEGEVHPKSQVSSPIEASNSTVRNQSIVPSTLHAEMCSRNIVNQKASFSRIKKSKKAITKTY